MSKVCNWNSVHTFAKSISADLSVFYLSLFFAFMKRSKRMRIMRRYEFEWTHKMRATKPKSKRKNATNRIAIQLRIQRSKKKEMCIAHCTPCTLLKHSTPVVLNTNNHNFKTIKPNRTREMSIIALSTVTLESNRIEWIRMNHDFLLFWHFYLALPLFCFITPHKAINRSGRRYRKTDGTLETFIHHQQFVMRSKE